jgi:hypothetical protein
VEFTERNIRRDPEARQVVIDGQMVIGFDQAGLEALLSV